MEGSSQSVQNSAVKESAVKVSVVQVSFFTGDVLWESIESVLRQEGVELELILVNNGNPPEVLKKLEALESGSDRITLISGQGNIGFGKACNLGASVASSEHLLFLNPDCVMFPDCVRSLLREADALPDDSLLGGNLFGPDGTACGNTRREFPTPGRLFVETLRLKRWAPNHPYIKRLNQEELPQTRTQATSVVSGALMMLQRSTFERLGGFDEAYFLHVEDIDICLRLHLDGGQSYFCSEAKAIHFKSSSEVSWFFIEKHKARGFRIFFRKHFTKSYPLEFIRLMEALTVVRLCAMTVMRSFTFARLRHTPATQVLQKIPRSQAAA